MGCGKFIVFEGIDGSGKTTISRQCADWLRSKGLDVVLTSEPHGTELGREIYRILKGKDMSLRAEFLLFLAQRSQHVSEVVLPSITEGKWVISSRFFLSTYVYQMTRNKQVFSSAFLRNVEEWSRFSLYPDLTIVLDIDPEIARKRTEKDIREDLEEIAEWYRFYSYQFPKTVLVPVGDEAETFRRVKSIIEERLLDGGM